MTPIVLTKDTVAPALARLLAVARSPRAILGAGAKAVEVALRAHMDKLQARGNEEGWPPSYFFAGRSTSVKRNIGVSELNDTRAVITIADPRFVHRLTGGTVRAKRGRMLAIPLEPEAKRLGGKGSLRESAPDLLPIQTDGGMFLAKSLGKRGAGGLKFYFVLKASVTHRAHPEEMPDERELSAKAGAAMLTAAQRMAGGAVG